MENLDLSLLTLGAVGLLILLVLVVLFRRPGGGDEVLRQEVASLKDALEQRDRELVGERDRAARSDALAGQRQTDLEALRRDIVTLREKLEESGQERNRLSNDITRLKAEMHAEGEAADEKIAMLTRLREEMTGKFRELAAEALKVQGEQFSKVNVERLQATLTPLKEHVGHFEKELKEVYKATIDDRAALKAEIMQLSKRSEAISQEAVALTRALRSDQQKQGAWGEMILESILERSGLREGAEYETQAHRTGEEGGRLRPDVVVKIPGGKTLVIDSKVSLVAYTDAVNAEEEAEALSARRRHLISLKRHIDGLSAKNYQNAEDSSVDYVILFVPIEGALSEALREDGQLTEYALDRNVTIATPTTLMMALKTVANVWAVERRNQNAEAIADRAGRLYDKVAGFVGSMEQVGSRLDQAQKSYDKAFGQLSRGSGNVLSQIDTLKSLGAKASKSISVDFDQVEGDLPELEADEEQDQDLA
ncbi:DNA recombination protein RmuC [Pseudooceanicola sp. HF7]|uniref:DNA recombination protein RmuC n=1 Tax=Pseudooceanicola sp. HF7 TaxID=2721560 RepID=UPI0020CA40AD|nr:DNA recombination protein RmuC [Pseudooceanicola sp. HF7]